MSYECKSSRSWSSAQMGQDVLIKRSVEAKIRFVDFAQFQTRIEIQRVKSCEGWCWDIWKESRRVYYRLWRLSRMKSRLDLVFLLRWFRMLWLVEESKRTSIHRLRWASSQDSDSRSGAIRLIWRFRGFRVGDFLDVLWIWSDLRDAMEFSDESDRWWPGEGGWAQDNEVVFAASRRGILMPVFPWRKWYCGKRWGWLELLKSSAIGAKDMAVSPLSARRATSVANREVKDMFFARAGSVIDIARNLQGRADGGKYFDALMADSGPRVAGSQ